MTSTRPIFLRNTMGHALEEFRAIEPGVVRLYTCGPTVYNYAHIGNFRAAIFADTLRRMLEYNGYEVRHVRNITDVGHLTNETLEEGLDRIERTAREQGTTPWDVARFYTDAFLEDAARLNLLAPTFMPRATEYIEPMIALADQLVDNGHAYVSDGDVYFAVDTFPTYGALSGNSVDKLVAGARVEVSAGKRSPADFALWKAAGDDKLMRWKSPWSEGVPGWHLECSAMAMDLLGEQIDIHTGGIDNMFPHHEDERAQSEAATGKTFARYWMHNAFLQLADEKMAKSKGNIYTISDLMERGIHPLTYRYFTFQAHYRSPLTFSWDALEAAQTALVRLWESVAELVQSGERDEIGKVAGGYQERFRDAINQDLDMPSAISVLHDLLGSQLPPGQKLTVVEDFDRVLGLRLVEMGRELSRTTPEQQALLDERADARRQKNWARSDELRAELSASGLEVRDSAAGQRWVRKDVLAARGRELQGATE